jgi:hypothetical protein
MRSVEPFFRSLLGYGWRRGPAHAIQNRARIIIHANGQDLPVYHVKAVDHRDAERGIKIKDGAHHSPSTMCRLILMPFIVGKNRVKTARTVGAPLRGGPIGPTNSMSW